MTYLSESLQKVLSEQMIGAPTLEECRRCEPAGGIAHHCCRTPGFAVYENIQLIYEKYRGGLWKEIPFASQELSIDQFNQFYFTQVVFTSNIGEKNFLLKLYFPRIIDHVTIVDESTGRAHSAGPRLIPDVDLNLLVSFPDDLYGFYARRNYERPTNQGCVFLERGQDWAIRNSKGCLLHADELTYRTTSKPIDCVSFNCKLRDSQKEKEKKTLTYFGELFLQFGTVA